MTESNQDEQIVYIVSGLPRSGTSMMMRMLEAGGLTILTDKIREADDNNPGGYYEFELAKKLRDGESEWLNDARGKVVKVIATLLTYLPENYEFKVIFMQREINEILASQKKMLVARGEDPDKISDNELGRLFSGHLEMVLKWLEEQPNIDFLMMDYNKLVIDPVKFSQPLDDFFDGRLDMKKIAGVVDKKLYRQRKDK